MWNFYFLLSSVIIFLVYRDDWKKLAFLFLLLIPFFGYIINTLRPFTNLAPLFYDLVFLIPLYLLILKKKKLEVVLPQELKGIFFLFVVIVFLQSINPFNPLPITARLIGIKVWLFYIPFIYIGYNLFEKSSDLLKFCRIFSVITIFPCSLSIIQYFFSIFAGYEVTMNFFYAADVAAASTQNYAQFNLTPSLTILRTPSTFTFPTQFGNYLLCSLVPVVTSIYSSQNFKEKNFYRIILILVLFASVTSGVRGMYLFIPIFFILFFFQRKNLIILFLFASLFFVIFFNFSNNFSFIAEYIYDLSIHYMVFFTEGFGINEIKDITGHGVGTSTGAVRYVIDQSIIQDGGVNESYYAKIFYELGLFGLCVLIFFYIQIYRQFNKCSKIYINRDISAFVHSSKALLLIILVAGIKGYYINLFPIDFLFYLLLGIIIKLNFLDNYEKKY
jgi:hypothetical protein